MLDRPRWRVASSVSRVPWEAEQAHWRASPSLAGPGLSRGPVGEVNTERHRHITHRVFHLLADAGINCNQVATVHIQLYLATHLQLEKLSYNPSIKS